MEGRIIQAIDIGTTKVAAIIARQTPNKKLEILGIGVSPSFGVIRADVKNISRTIDAIKKAVSEAEKQSGHKFTDVYVGIAGSHINSLQHRATHMREDYNEIISQKDIDKLKADTEKLPLPPGDMIIEILPQDYKVDNITNIVDPKGMLGSTIEVNMHVITGSQIAVNNIKRCIEEAGLEVKRVIMQPIASASAVLSKDEMESGVALVDIGGGTTDVAIFVEGIIGHTAVIPFGGEIITEDIRKGCKILKETAESIKVQHGHTFLTEKLENVVITIPGVGDRPPKEISMQMLVGIIQARMEEILAEVLKEFEMSGLSDKLNCGIVITGGGSQLKHLKQLAAFASGYEIKIGRPREHLSKTTVKNVDNPIFSTAIGLIIKGLEIEDYAQPAFPQKSNLVDKSTSVEKNNEKNPEKTSSLGKEEKTKKESVKKGDKSKGEALKNLMEKFGKWILSTDEVNDFNDTK